MRNEINIIMSKIIEYLEKKLNENDYLMLFQNYNSK